MPPKYCQATVLPEYVGKGKKETLSIITKVPKMSHQACSTFPPKLSTFPKKCVLFPKMHTFPKNEYFLPKECVLFPKNCQTTFYQRPKDEPSSMQHHVNERELNQTKSRNEINISIVDFTQNNIIQLTKKVSPFTYNKW